MSTGLNYIKYLFSFLTKTVHFFCLYLSLVDFPSFQGFCCRSRTVSADHTFTHHPQVSYHRGVKLQESSAFRCIYTAIVHMTVKVVLANWWGTGPVNSSSNFILWWEKKNIYIYIYPTLVQSNVNIDLLIWESVTCSLSGWDLNLDLHNSRITLPLLSTSLPLCCLCGLTVWMTEITGPADQLGSILLF